MARKITKLDCAILGLLSGQSMTGYEVRKVFEVSELGNYSSSPGAIYPALKRLEELSLVWKGKENGSGKQVYILTSNGRDVLQKWLTETLSKKGLTKQLDEILLRFAFMEKLIPKEQQIRFLESFILHLRTILKEMKTFHRMQGAALPVNGRLAFENGIAIHQAHLKWARKALSTIQNLNYEIEK